MQVVACQPDLRECNALRAACKGQLVQSSTFSHVEHLRVASCVVGVAQGARACESCVQFAMCARLMAICRHFGSAICLFLVAMVRFGFKLLGCFHGEHLWGGAERKPKLATTLLCITFLAAGTADVVARPVRPRRSSEAGGISSENASPPPLLGLVEKGAWGAHNCWRRWWVCRF